MKRKQPKYVLKPFPLGRWKIWNTRTNSPWGLSFPSQPTRLVNELNTLKRPEILTELTNFYRKHKDL